MQQFQCLLDIAYKGYAGSPEFRQLYLSICFYPHQVNLNRTSMQRSNSRSQCQILWLYTAIVDCLTVLVYYGQSLEGELEQELSILKLQQAACTI